MIKLSVIIPVYNAENYLKQTLDSVLQQSLQEIEVICVDDGSTDKSLEILRFYASKDNRVKILTQQNQYAGIARNVGLQYATGEYVHFLDADDYVLNYAYEAVIDKAEKYELDCLKFCAIAFDMQEGITRAIDDYCLSKLTSGDMLRPLSADIDSKIWNLGYTPWSGIYRRVFLIEKNIKFNGLKCVNDRSFANRVFTNSSRIMASRDFVVVHRINMRESLVGTRSQNFSCHYESISIIDDDMKRDKVSDELRIFVLKRELQDLLYWCKKFALEECVDNAEIIINETERFLSQQPMPVQIEMESRLFKIKDQYLKQLNSLPDPSDSTKESFPKVNEKKNPFFKEKCEFPKVSIIVPIYNVEEYLNEALYSLMKQTMEELEFICINDGSTDRSLIILKEYANIDKRFLIIDNPNGGYGKAMNCGIENAQGEYLGILEPDDFVDENMYEKLYKLAKKNNLDLTKGNFYRFKIGSNGSIVKRKYNIATDITYYGRVFRPIDETESFLFVMNTWSGIYKREFINKYNIRHNETPGASYQDNGFWFQTFVKAERVMLYQTPYYMNRRDNPNSSVRSKQKIYCITEEYLFIKEWIDKQDVTLQQQLLPIYYGKKFSNYISTYYRIAPELKAEYISFIAEDFSPIMNSGYIKQEYYSEVNWKMLHDIVTNPKEFIENNKISVIIPVYNAGKYLKECLDSIVERQEVPMEVICIDDGSTDDSLKLLREYEANYDCIKVILQENKGAGAARNHGLNYVTGSYLSFLDADDVFEPTMLRQAWEVAYRDNDDIVVFGSDQFEDGTNKYRKMSYTINKKLLPMEQPFAGKDIKRNIFKAFVGWAWDKLFKTTFIKELGLSFQEQRTTNDMLFVYSAIVNAKRISVKNNVLAHHRRANESLSVTREESWYCFYNALTALKKNLIKSNLYDVRKQDFINYALNFSLWNLDSMKGDSFYQLYEKLKTEWLSELEILSQEKWYFYDQNDYLKLQKIISMDSTEYKQNSIMELSKKIIDQQDEILRMKSMVNRLKKETHQLDKEKQKNKKLNSKVNKLRKENDEIKQSVSFRAGRALTYLPRKLKRG